ncbi:MAG: endonuclease III [Candidatus Omnitrophota bacterium]
MRENATQKKRRITKIIAKLKRAYPEAHCALHFRDPWQLLVATVLSAQCTDKRVNLITRNLFRKYRKVRDYARADLGTFENDIRSAGYYRAKARNIIGAAKRILGCFGGKVPGTMEALVTLPGVGRKTANVILANAFEVPGIAVDTHMIRLNRRLGLTRSTDPVKIERDLMRLLPEREWSLYSHRIIAHGRACCKARNPDCRNCAIVELCPSRRI